MRDQITPAEKIEEKQAAFYDNYDYKEFWKGRDYESESDAVAVVDFLKKTKTDTTCIIDVGGGLGRLVPYYAKAFESAILLDPSIQQLEETKARIGMEYPNLSFIRGIAQNIPVANGSVDVVVCVRVSHHIPEIKEALAEYKRILVPEGCLILDIANKRHMKARLKAFWSKEKRKKLASVDPVKVYGDEEEVPYVNHNPHRTIKEIEDLGFEILAIRSVSNLRSRLLKRIFPLSVLMSIERAIQIPLGKVFFGPSIFILARKK